MIKPNESNCTGCKYTSTCKVKEHGVNPEHYSKAFTKSGSCRFREEALTKLNMNTCFGCAHADVCFLSPVTGLFTVRFPQGDATCIAYDLFSPKGKNNA